MTPPLGRLAVRLAALLALPILACDAVDFPLLVGPTPPEPAAAIHLRYVQTDSLRGELVVRLTSWLPEGSTAAVTLDGRTIPRADAPGPEAFFGDSWTVPPAGLEDLPQVLGIPGVGGEEGFLIPLPAVLRDASSVVCVAEDDPLLPLVQVAVPSGSLHSWSLHLDSKAHAVILQGRGAPPEPLRVPREMLGTMAAPWRAALATSVHVLLGGDEDLPGHGGAVTNSPVSLSANLIIEWALIGAGSGHSACPGP